MSPSPKAQNGRRGNTEVYATVTARIIAQLEKGVIPWAQPWSGGGPPCNAVTLRPYHGCNVFVLGCDAWANNYSSRGWLTFNQARQAGVIVRKGERSCPVLWMNRVQKRSEACDGTKTDRSDNAQDCYWLARVFHVFSLDQLRDLEDGSGTLQGLRERCDGVRANWEPIAEWERVVAETGAVIRNGSQAAYVPGLDIITMPPRESFPSGAGYAAVIAHELTHWTGSPARLSRDLSGRFGEASYALEELVAELGAAFLTHRLGVDHVSQSAAYLASWLSALEDRPDAFVKAASEAQKAADFIWPPDAVTAEDHVAADSPPMGLAA